MALSGPHACGAPGVGGPAAAPPEDEGLWPGLRRLAVEEDGAAATEFIILFPCYVALMVAMFSLGNLVHARQGVVAAARFEAWSGRDVPDESARAAFFPGIRGQYTGTVARQGCEVTDRELDDRTPEENGRLGVTVSTKHRAIARAALNNDLGGQAPLRLSECRDATFRYQGIVLGARGPFSLSTRAAVVLANRHERPEHREGEQAHFVSRLPHAPFDPAAEQNRYLAPRVGPHLDRELGGRSADPGVWASDARLGGSPSAERNIFRGKPKPR